MLKSLLGLVFRQMVAGFACFTILLSLAGTAKSEIPTVFHLGLMIATSLVLVFEVSRLRHQLALRSTILVAHERVPPWRPELLLDKVGVFWRLAWLAIYAGICWLLSKGRSMTLVELLFLFFAMKGATWLLLGSWSRLRFWMATRGLASAQKVYGAFPLFVGIEAMVGIVLVSFPVVPGLKLFLWNWEIGGDTEFLVELGPDDQLLEIQPMLWFYGAKAERAVPHLSPIEFPDAGRTYVVTCPSVYSDVLKGWLRNNHNAVDSIVLNGVVELVDDRSGTPCPSAVFSGGISNDPLSRHQVSLRETGGDIVLREAVAPGGYSSSFRRGTSRKARLAVIDTGVDASHEDLKGLLPWRWEQPEGGHGTAIAGIAAAIGNNGMGMASLNDRGMYISLLDYPALESSNAGADDVADALFKAVDDDADVVVMAFSGRGVAPPLVREAVHYAVEEGVVLVAAAGNDGAFGKRRLGWPANLPGVLVVSGLDHQQLADFSTHVDPGDSIAAPAVDVCAPVPGGGYSLQTGTSMSAAIVAGALARRRAECIGDSAEDLLRTLFATSPFDRRLGVRSFRADRFLGAPCRK